MTTDELIDKITRAFANVPYPGDDDLTAGTYGEEPEQLVRAFSGRTDRWALDADFLDKAPDGWGSALSFFSDNAFRFYLPAYLVADIRGELDIADPAVRLCSSLTVTGSAVKLAKVWGGGTMGDRARAEFDRFDAEQASAVTAYLEWKLDADDYRDPSIEQALELYWWKREEGL